MKNILSFLILFFIASGTPIEAQIKLSRIFSDNMVLQRDVPVKIWGEAEPGETVALNFNTRRLVVKTSAAGKWLATLKPMKWGGPFDLTISTKKDRVVLKNILIGDVWICSGQSNMEMPVKGWSQVNNAEKEIAEAHHPNIRLFTVEKATSFVPENDLAGGQWLECNAANIGSFSAVAYFFGRKINADTKIPIGLVSTNWGGTNIQAWTSFEAISSMPDYKYLDIDKTRKRLSTQEQKRKAYNDALASDKGRTERWYKDDDIKQWQKITLPSLWENTVIGNNDGIIWFKKSFDVKSAPSGDVVLSLGPIDDADSTFLNGVLVGSGSLWNQHRAYRIKSSLLKPGKNTITIKMMDTGSQGGMSGKAEEVFIKVADDKISLAGEWYYKPSVLSLEYDLINSGPNDFPSQLFNAMIAPITGFKIKGVIWYQGESNAGEAVRYKTLFPAMIADWRRHWGYAFPFLWVQLANFMERKSEPTASAWAELREAQHQTLAVPYTAEAVSIDIGDAVDIHPRNKQDVGARLALAAGKLVYGKKVVSSGPVLASARKEGSRIILTFKNTGSGLMTKKNKLTGFAIAGNDRNFVWADAKIAGDKVIVANPSVKNPVAVRYAWADNPDAGLYNKENLPASPFRTDDWPLSTINKKMY